MGDTHLGFQQLCSNVRGTPKTVENSGFALIHAIAYSDADLTFAIFIASIIRDSLNTRYRHSPQFNSLKVILYLLSKNYDHIAICRTDIARLILLAASPLKAGDRK